MQGTFIGLSPKVPDPTAIRPNPPGSKFLPRILTYQHQNAALGVKEEKVWDEATVKINGRTSPLDDPETKYTLEDIASGDTVKLSGSPVIEITVWRSAVAQAARRGFHGDRDPKAPVYDVSKGEIQTK